MIETEAKELARRLSADGHFGILDVPRIIPTAGRTALGPESSSYGYQQLHRFRRRRIRIGWPIGDHSQFELEEHLKAHIHDERAVKVIVSHCAALVRRIKSNLWRATVKRQTDAILFMELWKKIEKEECIDCGICMVSVMRRKSYEGRQFAVS